ncbi:MAG TPA: hypothetical protein VF989_19470 [Polyangiaceae bacterium]
MRQFHGVGVEARRRWGAAVLGLGVVAASSLAPGNALAQDRECETDAECGFGFECYHHASSGTTGGGPAVCGNNICEHASETIESCPTDCDRYTDCTPVECVTNSDCANEYVCEDLPLPGVSATGGPTCGDHVCNGSETRASCAEDCVPERRCRLPTTYCSSDDECPDGFHCAGSGSTTGVGGFSSTTGSGGSSAVGTGINGQVATVSGTTTGSGAFSVATAFSSVGAGGSTDPGDEAGGSAGMGNDPIGTCQPDFDGAGGASDGSTGDSDGATGLSVTAAASTTGSGSSGTTSGDPGAGGASHGGASNSATGAGGASSDGATTGNGASTTSSGTDSGTTSSSVSGTSGGAPPGTGKDRAGCSLGAHGAGANGLFALFALALGAGATARARNRRRSPAR